MHQSYFSKTIEQELKNRSQSRLGQKFNNSLTEHAFPIFTSSSDLGVIRNGGRRGTQFAPLALLNSFKALVAPEINFQFFQQEVVNECQEFLNFDQSQTEAQSVIEKVLEKSKAHKFVHLGGGHDHIYPLLKALENRFHKLDILNIDAHMDTRTDSWAHSGTPFRQFSNSAKGPFSLWQFGIHPFANPHSNYNELKKANLKISPHNEINLQKPAEIEKQIKAYFDKSECAVLSLDADGMDGSVMEAVSAVNPNGIKKEIMQGLMNGLLASNAKIKVLAIYEFNPIFENLSQKSQRYLASLIYQFYFHALK